MAAEDVEASTYLGYEIEEVHGCSHSPLDLRMR